MARKNTKSSESKVALAYIRRSYTRSGEEDESNSPERQRANIEAICQRNGWTPEFYEDIDGHKSGTKEQNRPGWLALKARLSDPDVVALVANDLARLHRKGWRVGDLIDFLNQRNITLVLAAPGREIDLSSAIGRLFVEFTAILDEWYAADISQRAKDSILHRKRQGKVVGLPPFATIRNDEGYLIPTVEGAWYLADGRFVAGEPDAPPSEDALWRGYYQTALYILQLYATGEHGLENISYRLNIEGYPFRDRNGRPRLTNREDIRRVVANWPEYGGMVTGDRGKDRPAYEDYNPDEIPFNEDRAVFPIELLRAVARVRKQRTVRPINQGINRTTYPYPLNSITFCAHCEQLATLHNDPKLRTRLGGSDTYGTRRYRHKAGVYCGCQNRSVPCEEYEADFSRLVSLLTVKPEAIDLMLELAIQADRAGGFSKDTDDFEAEKHEALALCQRKIDAAINLYRDGRISREDYLRDVDKNEREMAHWQSRTSETEQAALELALCMDALDKLSKLWVYGTDEDKQGIVRNLFSSVSYDLDTRRIVDFQLKAWADRFLTLRANLYDYETDNGDGNGGQRHAAEETREDGSFKGTRQHMVEKPLGGTSRFSLLKQGAFLFFCFMQAGLWRVFVQQPPTSQNIPQLGLDSLVKIYHQVCAVKCGNTPFI